MRETHVADIVDNTQWMLNAKFTKCTAMNGIHFDFEIIEKNIISSLFHSVIKLIEKWIVCKYY